MKRHYLSYFVFLFLSYFFFTYFIFIVIFLSIFLGMTHNNKKTFPRLADVLGFCLPHQAIDVGEKVLLVQVYFLLFCFVFLSYLLLSFYLIFTYFYLLLSFYLIFILLPLNYFCFVYFVYYSTLFFL